MGTQRVDRYWSNRFGLEPNALYEAGVRVVRHARPWADNFAYVFVRGSACVLSVGAAFVHATHERVSKRDPDSFLRDADLREAFELPIHHTVGPAYQGYAEKEDFLPQTSDCIRKLRDEERKVLLSLKNACEPIAWEHSGIDAADSGLFGCFVGGDLAAVAHYSLWADDAASIGVLSHPAHRSRGYGKAVVSAAMADAFEQGHLVIYQTLSANHPSVRLATALGCRDYARTMAVHFTEDSRLSG